MRALEMLASAGYSFPAWSPGGFLANAPGAPGEQLIGWYSDEDSAIGACGYHLAETKKLEQKKEKKNATAAR